MESNFGIQLTLGVVGVAPAIFFHMDSRGFLAASVLAALTSGWTVTLLLVFYSGLSWGLAGIGGLGWVPSFFVVAVVVGGAVRVARKALELRRGKDSVEDHLTPDPDEGAADERGLRVEGGGVEGVGDGGGDAVAGLDSSGKWDTVG